MTNAKGARGPAGRVRVLRICTVFAASAVVSILIPRAATAQSLPSGWTVVDVGRPALTGSARAIACGSASSPCPAVSVTAAGHGIGGWTDQFAFMFTPLRGDGSVVARVEALMHTDPWASAGVMIRESLAAGARHASSLVSAEKGVAFQRRRETGASSLHTGGSGRAAPVWLRLDRNAATVSAYESADGVSWRLVGRDTMEMPSTVYVGVAVTSHDVSTPTTARISGIDISNSNGGTLPDGWHARDVGAPALSGSSSYGDRAFTIRAAGEDIWSTADQFHYAYRSVSGDADVIARVSGLEAVDDWTKAGVMIRESLAGNAAHAHMLVSGREGLAFQRRLAAGAQTLHTSAASGGAPGWLKLERRGVAVSAFWSRDGVAWTFVGSDLFDLPSTFYVGLAVTSHDPGGRATAVFDSVTVRQVSGGKDEGEEEPTDSGELPAEEPLPGSSPAPASVLVFQPSSDHDTNVAGYRFEVALTTVPSVVLLRQDLGKLVVVDGECFADVSALLRLLPAGSYIGTVRAFNGAGVSAGASTTFVR